MNITTLYIFRTLALPAYQQKITECAAVIMERYSEVQSSIVYENVGKLADNILGNEMVNTTRIINIEKYSNYKKNELEPYYMLTIILRNLLELEKYFNSVYRILGWNSRSKHFIIYIGDEDVLKIFQLSWDKFITKLVVLDKKQDLYTYDPLKEGNCGTIIRKHYLFNCANMNLETLDQIYAFGDYQNYHGCKVRVLTYPIVPYVMNVEDARSPGFEILALKELAERLNFTIEYVKHSHNYWGVKNHDNTYTEMYQDFLNKEADIMLGMLVANGTFLYDFDSTISHTKSDLAFFVPPAEKSHPWENIMKVYSTIIWTTIGSVCVCMSLLWYFIGTQSKQSKSFHIVAVLGMQIGKPMIQPRTYQFRYIFLIWTIYSLILTSMFESSLMSFLTKPSYEPEIDTIDRLVNAKLKIGGFEYARELFVDANKNADYLNIFKNWVDCELNEQCVNRTAASRDFAALNDVRQINYLTPKYYLNSDGSDKVHQMPISSSFYMWFLTLKGFPLRNGFDQFIQKFIQYGFMEKWVKDVSYENRVVARVEHVALTIQHILFPLGIMAAGCVLGIIVFVVELVYAKTIRSREEQSTVKLYKKSF